jgi:phosphopantothenoylcysteine decarboxylase/phosphopantothenate--cysteine ligase
MHSEKRILLIIGGGIAAYKVLELCRLLRRRSRTVRAILTKAGEQFVTPLSVGSVTGDKVYGDLFSLTDEAEMGHIELSRDADLVVVAPATADLLAKMAHGLANDLATTALLATDKRILVAPAMNVRMWHHPATQRSIATLKADGVTFVGPNSGSMACGEFGIGRLAEPPEILDAIEALLATDTRLPLPGDSTPATSSVSGLGRPLSGRHVLVTSGPTLESIDPVRFIANRSSGRQGHAIAEAAAAAGARVTLVSGPVSLPDPFGVHTQHVESAREMLAAVESSLPADVFIAAAAVADWRVEQAAPLKLKKGAADASLTLVPNPDILSSIAHHASHRPALVVGFAAETHDVIAHAEAKRLAKGCDLIVANDVSLTGETPGGVMGAARNTVHLVTAAGVEDWPTLDKRAVADRLVAKLAHMLARVPHT